MPSFDVVSEVDAHELNNAIDQSNRSIANRYDFKDTGAKIEIGEGVLKLEAQAEFQIKQMHPVLLECLSKRGIDVKCLEHGDIQTIGQRAQQSLQIRQGIDRELAKRLVKTVKDAKLKVQAAVQGEQIRVTGKKRDDLQQVIALLKQQQLDRPLQFNNFRD